MSITDDLDSDALISRLAGPLSPPARAAFRAAAEDALTRVACWGEGAVYRAVASLQRAFFDPPSDARALWGIGVWFASSWMVCCQRAFLMLSSARSGPGNAAGSSSCRKCMGSSRGMRVKVLQGPLQDQIGLLAALRPHERVLVLLQLLGGQQRVELARNAIEAVLSSGF